MGAMYTIGSKIQTKIALGGKRVIYFMRIVTTVQYFTGLPPDKPASNVHSLTAAMAASFIT
jgi:hypothetical protein